MARNGQGLHRLHLADGRNHHRLQRAHVRFADLRGFKARKAHLVPAGNGQRRVVVLAVKQRAAHAGAEPCLRAFVGNQPLRAAVGIGNVQHVNQPPVAEERHVLDVPLIAAGIVAPAAAHLRGQTGFARAQEIARVRHGDVLAYHRIIRVRRVKPRVVHANAVDVQVLIPQPAGIQHRAPNLALHGELAAEVHRAQVRILRRGHPLRRPLDVHRIEALNPLLALRAGIVAHSQRRVHARAARNGQPRNRAFLRVRLHPAAVVYFASVARKRQLIRRLLSSRRVLHAPREHQLSAALDHAVARRSRHALAIYAEIDDLHTWNILPRLYFPFPFPEPIIPYPRPRRNMIFFRCPSFFAGKRRIPASFHPPSLHSGFSAGKSFPL